MLDHVIAVLAQSGPQARLPPNKRFKLAARVD
jgi:hypothetical protein